MPISTFSLFILSLLPCILSNSCRSCHKPYVMQNACCSYCTHFLFCSPWLILFFLPMMTALWLYGNHWSADSQCPLHRINFWYNLVNHFSSLVRLISNATAQSVYASMNTMRLIHFWALIFFFCYSLLKWMDIGSKRYTHMGIGQCWKDWNHLLNIFISTYSCIHSQVWPLCWLTTSIVMYYETICYC